MILGSSFINCGRWFELFLWMPINDLLFIGFERIIVEIERYIKKINDFQISFDNWENH